MYDRFKNQYIFKMANGKIINYFFKENTGICTSSINRRNLWSDSTVLARDSTRGFSADIDKNDRINLVYQDTKGNLFVMRFVNTQYKIFKLLNSKNITTYDKHLKLINFSESIFCLYVVEHNGNKLLSFQSSNKDLIFSNPKVIDYCEDSALPFTAFLDPNGMLVVFYYSKDSKRGTLGIKIINCENDSVGEFISVSDYSSDALILGGFSDTEGNYHLLWERKTEENYELCYSCKARGSDKFETERVIDISASSHINASLIERNNSLICYWVVSNTVFFSASFDKARFSTPEIYTQFEGKQFYCITYKDNTQGRLNRSIEETLPVNFTNGLHFAFSDLKLDNSPENRSNTIQSFSIKDRSSEYDSKLKGMNDRIEVLEKRLTQNDMEMQKVLIRISQLESDLNKKIKAAKAKPYDEEIRTNKAPSNIEPNVLDRFRNMENKIISNDFVQDPKIEEIKKQIAMETKGNTKNEKAEVKKDESEAVRKFKEQSMNNFPMMQGSGFSSITPEYLKNLGKKHE